MKKNQNIPVEEIEKIIDALENGQEINSSLPKEAVEIIRRFYQSIEKLPVREEFVNSLLEEIRQKISEKKESNIYSFSWLNIKSFATVFASLVIVGGIYYAFQNLELVKDIVDVDNKIAKTETNKSPVLERFLATDDVASGLETKESYKERAGRQTRAAGSGSSSSGGLTWSDKDIKAVEEIDYEMTDSMPVPSMGIINEGALKSETNTEREIYDDSFRKQEVNDLKGGEIDDNEKFEEYQKYIQSAVTGSGYIIDISQRNLIEVVDSRGVGVLSKKVIIVDNLDNRYEILTDSDGKIYFYPSVYLVNSQNGKISQNQMCNGKKDLYRNRSDIACEAYWEGYYFDAEIGRCIKESTSGCSNPYYFSDKQSCEEACGQAEKIASNKPNKFELFIDNQKYEFLAEDKTWRIDLKNKENNTDNLVLDLVFTLDTTGSMSDQINKLKMTIESISEKITDNQVKPKIRYGLVAYRDKGDEYLTRIYDFTEDLEEFKKTLQTIRAAGGGDYPEDVNTALADTLEQLNWSNSKNAVRISFLIADAPPHMDYGQKYDYKTAMLRALELGVKIFPIASSGLDNTEGEFIFRQIALITNAKYVFITNASGGTDYHVSEQDYSVNALDSLVVKLIKTELDQVR